MPRLEVPFANQEGQSSVTQNSQERLFPPFAQDYSADGAFGNSEATSDMTLFHGSRQKADFCNIMSRKLNHIVPLAPVVRAVSQLIRGVLRRRSPTKVPRVTAKPVAARVRGLMAYRRGSAVEGSAHHVMNAQHLAPYPNMAVSVRVFPVRPQKAIIAFVRDDFFRKKAFWLAAWCVGHISKGIAKALPSLVVRYAPASRGVLLAAPGYRAYTNVSHINLLTGWLVRTRLVLQHWARLRLYHVGGANATD